jgi:predicted DNA-binding protein with PD1-like motif
MEKIMNLIKLISLGGIMEFEISKVYVFRVPENTDLIDYLSRYVMEKNIKSGFINVIGSLIDPVIGYFNVEKKRYEEIELKGFYELASGIGNISLKEEKPFIHLHVVLGDPEGKAYAGHLLHGKTYVAEVVIIKLRSEYMLQRIKHGSLWLWPIKE